MHYCKISIIFTVLFFILSGCGKGKSSKDASQLQTFPEGVAYKDMVKRKIKVAAAQILTKSDIKKNLSKIKAKMREAHKAGCEIILFHEGCLTGYPSARALKKLKLSKVSKAEKEIQKLAKKLYLATLVGSTSKEKGNYYNDVLIINEHGTLLGRYSKTWRAGEAHYTAGSGPVIFKVAGVLATAIICHDLRYPELVRLPVAAGAQIVFIANNESGLTLEHKLLGYRSMQISRGTENLVYAVMCNCPADPRNIKAGSQSHGNSKIADPMGNVLDEAGYFEERLVMAELDLKQSTRRTALRIIGKWEGDERTYGTCVEHPAYTEWMKEGLKMVRRLDGKTTLR
jgi:predicted amidohydrolase